MENPVSAPASGHPVLPLKATTGAIGLVDLCFCWRNCCPGRWPNTGWAPTRMPWRRQKIRPSNLSLWAGRNEKYTMKHLHYNEWNPRYVCESGSSYRLPHWDLHQRLCLWGRLNSLWLFRRSSYSSCAKMFIHRSSGWSSKRHWSRSKDLMISWRTPQR